MNTRTDKPSAVAGVLTAPAVQATPDVGHKVLRDTYRLLSATLMFSALVAGTSAALQLPAPGLMLTLASGPQLVATTMGVTGLTFIGLSWYARSANAVNALNWGNFLMIGILTAFGLGLAAYFFQIPALAVSGLFVLLMSGLIVFETQNIVRGGETNYILATVSLFVTIFNLFISLLHIFGFLGGEDA